MTKRHENLWLQGKELDKRVVKYWADPPQPFHEYLAVSLQKSEATSSGIVLIFWAYPTDEDDSVTSFRHQL